MNSVKQAEPLFGVWSRANYPDDVVEIIADYLNPKNAFKKAKLFDDYLAYNDSETWIKDMRAEFNQATSHYKLLIDGTEVSFEGVPRCKPSDDEDSPEWAKMIQTFGKAGAWDELIDRVNSEVLMTRLGYFKL